MAREELLRDAFLRIYAVHSQYRIEVSPYRGEVLFSAVANLRFQPIATGDSWGTLFDRAWFRLALEAPDSEAIPHTDLVLLIDVGGEGLVYDADGNSLMGITNKLSSYGLPPDKPGKWVVPIAFEHRKCLYVDASCNDLFGYVQQGGLIQQADLGSVDRKWRRLYYDLEVLCDWESGMNDQGSHQPSKAVQSTTKAHAAVSRLLDRAEQIFANQQENAYDRIVALVEPFFQVRTDNATLNITATGHAHLDIAWLWPIGEGRRKARRTFATALTLMDRYPDYVFGASQFQLFDWIFQDDPRLFARVADKVKEGRFELQGVFWVECDLNLPSLESLIRQIHYGREFVMTHFGQDVTYVWEPDVFGLTGALPQILIKSGVKAVCSQKLSQNKVNRFPHHSFGWRGLDGSTVLVHHFPEETYDSRMRPASAMKLVHQYHQKDQIPHALMVFGVGDGGGGPGEEHLERYLRIRDVQGLPKLQMGRVDRFLEKWSQFATKMPIVDGELYFERHQGTYTTEVLNKIGNETMERLLSEYEFLAGMHWLLWNLPVDWDHLDRLWKEVLLYQFHDILPGSSIMPVYEHTRTRYRELIDEIESLMSPLRRRFLERMAMPGWFVFNPTGFSTRDWMKIDGCWYRYDVPAYGIRPLETISYQGFVPSGPCLNNGIVEVSVGADGSITSLANLASHHEYIDQTRLRPMWTVYHELAHEYPAWDFAEDYRNGTMGHPKVIAMTVSSDGPTQQIVIEFVYMASTLRTTLSLTEGSGLVKLACEMNWKETNTSVKLAWPITIDSPEATCHMQYGNIQRPTHDDDSFARAKDEIYAHQFVDVSDTFRGIALIAPQKYGFRVKEKRLEVSILRSQKKNGSELGLVENPDYLANHYGDLVYHRFELGLFPHEGTDLLEVERTAHPMKHRVWIERCDRAGVMNPDRLFDIDNEAVTIASIKPAYNQKGLILRLIEHTGKPQSFAWKTPLRFAEAWLCDMQETPLEPLNADHIPIGAFEVLTICLWKERREP